MIEEVLIRMGLDSRPVSAALRGVRKDFASFKQDMKGSNPFEMLKGGLGALGIAASAGALVALGKSAIEFAGRIKDTADAVNASASTLQAWGLAVGESGGSAEDAEKALAKLAEQARTHGRTTDQELAVLMDRVKDVRDPLDQLNIATDTFGEKLGVKVVNALKMGSDAFEQFKKASSGSILTDSEVARLDEIGDRMAGRWAKTKAIVGKGIVGASDVFGGPIELIRGWLGMAGLPGGQQVGASHWVTDLAARLGASGGGGKSMSAAEMKQIAAAAERLFKAERDLNMQGRSERGKLVILQREQAALEEEAQKHERGSLQYIEAQVKLTEKEAEIQSQLEKVRKQEADFLKKKQDDLKKIQEQKDRELETTQSINDAAEKGRDLYAEIDRKKGERGKFTLGELADTNIDRFTTGKMAGEIMTARNVRFLEQRGKALAAHGYGDAATQAFSKADELRSGITSLTETERAPFAEMEKQALKQAQALDRLVAKAERDGMKVEVVGVAQ